MLYSDEHVHHADEKFGRFKQPRMLKYSVRNLALIHKFSTEIYKSLGISMSSCCMGSLLRPPYISQLKTDSDIALSYLDTALHYNSLSFGPFRKALKQLASTA
ncbi:uncharacterized protein N7482_003484 [Penicillium canariense]|uniref:Uncharacterized protein n=1 Tax=Penicillium canariense TaxID=189055 RepID=A0A9W9LPC7_9EURO|nr:uncharacterized protein N7482_003484 [Penicillium canariense]KAJ5167890.1 hypothetical protein N7482_003484 [Penicillium canariense]